MAHWEVFASREIFKKPLTQKKSHQGDIPSNHKKAKSRNTDWTSFGRDSIMFSCGPEYNELRSFHSDIALLEL